MPSDGDETDRSDADDAVVDAFDAVGPERLADILFVARPGETADGDDARSRRPESDE